MKLAGLLTDLPRSRSRASHIVLPERALRGRPRGRFRLAIQTPDDVLEARRLGAPVFLLTPELVTALGYPLTFPPHLLVTRDFATALDTHLPLIFVASADSALRPRIEDVVAALLHIDPHAARGVASRNRRSIDPLQLLRRVVQAESEREATLIRLQEFAPLIPELGRPLPKSQIERLERDAQVVGLRA